MKNVFLIAMFAVPGLTLLVTPALANLDAMQTLISISRRGSHAGGQIPSAATSFDGSGYGSALTTRGGQGAPVDLPTSSQALLVSFDYNSTTVPAQGVKVSPVVAQASSGRYDIASVSFVGDGNGTAHLEVLTRETPDYHQSVFTGPQVPLDGQWHNVTVSAQTGGSGPSADYSIDAATPAAMSVTNTDIGSGTTFSMTWQDSVWSIGGGSISENGQNFSGALAEVFAYVNSHNTLTQALADKFWDPTANGAPGLGTYYDFGSGRTLSECAVPLGVVPNICNRGSPTEFTRGPYHDIGGGSHGIAYLMTVANCLPPNGVTTTPPGVGDPCAHGNINGQRCRNSDPAYQ